LNTLIDVERQWFKANIGLPGVPDTQRDIAFCAHAILGSDVYEISETMQDLKFSDNSLLAGNPDIRFYASAAKSAVYLTYSNALALKM
jgi:hypothetical protein